MRRSSILALVLFLLIEGLFAWRLWDLFRREGDRTLALTSGELQSRYRGVIASKGDLIGALMQQAIDVPAVRSLLDQAGHAQAPEQARLRGRLYRLLNPTFEILRGHDVRGLQLVLADGRSFLRFHRPDLFGDPIAAQRPLLTQVLNSGEPHRAFEHGRACPGFRYAYPIKEGSRVLGLADLCVSFDAVRKVLQEAGQGLGLWSQLLLNRQPLEAINHPSAQDLYRPVTLNPAFLVENRDAPLAQDLVQALEPPVWVESVDQILSRRPRVQSAMAEGRPYAGHVCTALHTCFAAVLLPIQDSVGRAAGFIAAYRDRTSHAALRERLALTFVVGTLLLLVAGSALRRWFASRERLRIVSETMAEGLYLIDREGKTLFVNRAAARMLGYSQAELRGGNAHERFHVNCQGQATLAEDCPIRLAATDGQVLRSEDETFRHRDGSLLRVSLVSSPLHIEGEIVGSIVLFRDISAEYQDRQRLQRADVAMRNLAEAVMVTDPKGYILAINPAFTQITGYAEEEVLGQTPRLFASGRHDASFYARLWKAILTTDAWEGEIWNRRKNGSVYPEWLKINAIRGESGELNGYVAVFADTTEIHAKEERLLSLAYHDQLTGLYNRSSFAEVLERALNRVQSRGGQLSLLYLDLDRFKRINDTLGHPSGDLLLVTMARRLRAGLRPQDEVARLGGDEFAILLDEVDQGTTPARIAQDLLARTREPIDLNGRPIHLSTSIGISLYPGDGQDAPTLLKNAEAAMYLAKYQGRDGYRYYSPAMAREAEQRFELESDLRLALELDQLRLAYQPQIDLQNGAVLGVEALLRWEHPARGLLLPGQFLDVARNAGLMPRITEWVLREAARQCREWRDHQVAVDCIAVNLDTQCLAPGSLEALLLRTVHEAGIVPSDLELEILETAMLVRDDEKGVWEGLVDHGFQLAIDDFGIGESSLGRVKRLPARTLKIDRSFVADIETDENSRSIVTTIVAMAETLGKRTLAEGVETEAQLRFLIDAGCDAVQGYYFSHPVAPAQIPELVDSRVIRAKVSAAAAGRYIHRAQGAR